MARIRAAGAIVLAKANMAELAFSPYETVSSILPGYTQNPYELDRVTAGSSGGTAAAVAASMGAVGPRHRHRQFHPGPVVAPGAGRASGRRWGSPAAAGVVPLFLAADITGPMARTVADAVAVLQVIAGPDPDDPVTAASRGHASRTTPRPWRPTDCKGARIGVLHQAYDTATTDPEIARSVRAGARRPAPAGRHDRRPGGGRP